jgi:transcriptional regulator with XRE-family HTH domain
MVSDMGVRSRRVSNELRRYRELAGLTGVEAAAELGMSPSKISRIETGNRGLREEDVTALLTLYRVPVRVREELLDLVRRADEAPLVVGRSGVLPRSWKNLARLEARARAIQVFEPLVLPELVQIPEYAAAVIGGLRPELGVVETDALVAARVGRQVRLRHREVEFLAVVEEMVLHRVIGDAGVMRRQLRHLGDLAELPNVTVLVRPFASGAHRGLGGAFTVLDFVEEPSVALAVGQGGVGWLDDEDDVASVRGALTDVLSGVLDAQRSAALIRRLIRPTPVGTSTPGPAVAEQVAG